MRCGCEKADANDGSAGGLRPQGRVCREQKADRDGLSPVCDIKERIPSRRGGEGKRAGRDGDVPQTLVGRSAGGDGDEG